MSNPFPSFTNLTTPAPELVPIPQPPPDNFGLHPQPRGTFVYPYPHPAMQAHYHPDAHYSPPPLMSGGRWPPGHPYSPYVPMAMGSQQGFNMGGCTKPKKPSKPKGPYGAPGGRRPKSKHSSCEPCRLKKSKCDKRENCSSCRMRGDVCIWAGAIPVQPSTDLPDFPEASTQALREIARLRNLVHNLAARLGVDPNAPDSPPGNASPSHTGVHTSSEHGASPSNDSGSPSPSLSATLGDIPVLPALSVLTEISDMDDSRTPTACMNRLFDGDYGSWGYDQSLNAKALWPGSGFSPAGGPGEFPSWNESS